MIQDIFSAKPARTLLSAMGLMFLASCNTDSATSGLRPTAAIGNPPAQQQAQQPQQAATTETALVDPNAQAAPDNLSPTQPVSFLPVVGPPQFAVSKLSGSIRNAARNNQITIAQAGQGGASYQVKGYFSALDDGAGTRFVYIWDILDASGRNVHRISGEERTSGRSADPWQSVDANMIDNVVNRTMQNLRGWISTRG